VQQGVRAPRPPGFGAGEDLGNGGASPVPRRELPLDRDVAGEERVALAEGAHGDVLRGPFADAGERSQLRGRIVEVAARVSATSFRCLNASPRPISRFSARRRRALWR
jgi:hypothetical protein